MLQLPAAETLADVGCNLSIAQVLLASISGVSAVLYSTTGGSGAVFQDFMVAYYPWDAEPQRDNGISGVEAAKVLYEEYRNPLTHASGTPVISVERGKRREYRPDRRPVQINRMAIANDERPRRGLSEQRVNELESEPTRPSWLPPTLKLVDGRTVLTVESLYWGFRASVQRLCSDRERMDAVVRFFRLGS
jgi:hypothetical protein